ncbi:DUF748 domain-containing protein [Tunicatimonas pelagia]|uniref:DUF748 domain-containing protein n=1 Tax=Tunicatimonas pelagia TaxID=931531 RepID=UPI0026669605|nr:DUF748 domain-containing protein [Tunicatimonas pelagia]WKN43644.1 DUF748 domain-containing protein [Tunicatimonas pelagia]
MKKAGIALAIIIGVFILLHFLLEPFVERYVNQQLSSLEEYTGQVSDIDIHLYRGAYQVKGLELVKRNSEASDPFLQIDTIDLSVEWGALFDGRVVGEVILSHPTVTMIVTPTVEGDSAQEQTGSDVDWVQQVQELIPLTINRFEIKNGDISYKDPSVDPKVDAYFRELYLLAENISNVADSSQQFPSSLQANAVTVGNGTLNADLQMNLLKNIPEFKADIRLEDVDLTKLNDFIKAYANFDVQEGTFEIVTEMTVENQQISGYIKPFFENLDVFDLREDIKQDDSGFFQKAWEAIAGLGAEAFENQKKDQIATEVPIEGSLESPSPDVPVTVWNIFRNAFIDAIEKNFESVAR